MTANKQHDNRGISRQDQEQIRRQGNSALNTRTGEVVEGDEQSAKKPGGGARPGQTIESNDETGRTTHRNS